jgi:hypothetical protein
MFYEMSHTLCMSRPIVYGLICGIVAPLVLAAILTLLPPSLADNVNQLGMILLMVPFLLGVVAGAWLGNSIDRRLERKPLTKEDDSRMAKAFVLILISLSLVVSFIHYYDCNIAHLNLPECGVE